MPGQVKPHLRPARAEDAEGMAQVLMALRAVGKRRKAADPDFVLDHYIQHPNRISLNLATMEDRVLGFQSLKLATPDNPYGTPVGWGIIGTHIHPEAARRGLGTLLAQPTIAAARAAGLKQIEAQIGTANGPALTYYAAIGFADTEVPGTKVLHLLTE